ncbi:hypothetical protein IWX48DRAFT_624805 [Phyllosticta citricarpa]
MCRPPRRLVLPLLSVLRASRSSSSAVGQAKALAEQRDDAAPKPSEELLDAAFCLAALGPLRCRGEAPVAEERFLGCSDGVFVVDVVVVVVVVFVFVVVVVGVPRVQRRCCGQRDGRGALVLLLLNPRVDGRAVVARAARRRRVAVQRSDSAASWADEAAE